MEEQLNNIILANQLFIKLNSNRIIKNFKVIMHLFHKLTSIEFSDYRVESIGKNIIYLQKLKRTTATTSEIIIQLFYKGLMKDIKNEIIRLMKALKYEPLLQGFELEYYLAEKLE